MYDLSGCIESIHGGLAKSSFGAVLFGNPIVIGIVLTMTTLILMHRLYDSKNNVYSYRKVMAIGSLINISYLFFSLQLLTSKIEGGQNIDNNPMELLECGRDHLVEEFDIDGNIPNVANSS